MNSENSVIGSRIRSLREYQKLSREKLAEKADISTQFLADIESGKKGMTVVTLKKICRALCVTADSIVFAAEGDAGDNSEIMAMINTVSNEKKEEVEEIVQKIIKLID